MRKRFLILFLFLSGCMGPAVGPDIPDNTDKADPALVQECRLAFGEFGKADAARYGWYYLALSDLVSEKKLDVSNWSQFLELAERATKKADVLPKNYPSFEAILTRYINEYQPGPITDEDRKKFSGDFKKIGLSLIEAGK